MKVFLVIEYGADDDLRVRGVFEDEAVATSARDAGLGTEVQPWEIETFAPEPMMVYVAIATLAEGVHQRQGYSVFPIDLPGERIDELRELGTAGRWVMHSLDREKAVAAVTEALAARRAELGVPNV